MELTKSELELMQVLWNAGYALSRADILKHTENKTWKDSYIHLLLNSLMRKDAIKEAGFVRSGKTWGRLYAPNISCEEYYSETVFNKVSADELTLMFSAMLENQSITRETLSAMREMLDAKLRTFGNVAELKSISV